MLHKFKITVDAGFRAAQREYRHAGRFDDKPIIFGTGKAGFDHVSPQLYGDAGRGGDNGRVVGVVAGHGIAVRQGFHDQRHVPAIGGLRQLHRHDVRFLFIERAGEGHAHHAFRSHFQRILNGKDGSRIGNGIIKNIHCAIDA